MVNAEFSSYAINRTNHGKEKRLKQHFLADFNVHKEVKFSTFARGSTVSSLYRAVSQTEGERKEK